MLSANRIPIRRIKITHPIQQPQMLKKCDDLLQLIRTTEKRATGLTASDIEAFDRITRSTIELKRVAAFETICFATPQQVRHIGILYARAKRLCATTGQ